MRLTFDQLITEALLQEKKRGPTWPTLKKNQVKLDPEEREKAMKAGAVWHHGSNGEETCGIQKSVVDGKTWWHCHTHRAMAVRPTLKGAISAFDFIETTS